MIILMFIDAARFIQIKTLIWFNISTKLIE